MRIIHTSDWHLGQYFYGKSRAKEHQQFLNWLLSQIEQHHVDVLLVAGDIFDTATPPSYAREMYFNFISKMQKLNCHLVVLAGNHDSVSMLSESKTLLSALSTHVVANVKDPTNASFLSEQVFTLYDSHNQPQAVICAVPFIRPRDVIKSQAGQDATDKSRQLQQAIVNHYALLYERAEVLVKKIGKSIPIIATGHLTALGVKTSESVRDIYIGTLEAFPSNAFPKANYIALGHIHRAQKVGKTEHIRYCGSPLPLSFDEANQQKKVLLVDFEQDQLTHITELVVPIYQPLIMLKTSLNSLSVDLACALKKLNSNENDSEATVWLDVELSDNGVLSHLQTQIAQVIKEFPVEVLLVRREKQVRQHLLTQYQQAQSTLNELSIEEVFTSRLNQETWLSNVDDISDSDKTALTARKESLQTLFNQAVEQVNTADNADNILTTLNTDEG